ncbi:MAG: alpha-ketoacid dehydrogenase subunit beta [Christensenellaceae bacterium]|nr:alpha-ketoacid dehydrogenase subunit beta [Christensenellaceae bacterium]
MRLTYAQTIKETLAQEMRRDERVFVMGEDVQVLGGVFGCTRGLADEFGVDRCFNTPISEAGFVGAGLGAACVGMRPVVELMYMDFSLVAADQIVNQVAKTRYIFGGKAKIPLVIRGQQGIGRGNAATHSQSLETLFMHVPGLKIACPSTAVDAMGLLRTAIRDDNPVLFFEHKALYNNKEEVPDDPDFMIPFGKADVKRVGKDVTIVANLLYVPRALEAAEILAKEGIDAEVIDPRTIAPFDYDTIIESVKKTGRLVIAHEAHKIAGWSAQLSAEVTERAFKYLDAPIMRLGAKHCPLAFNLGLENAIVPQVAEIVEAAKQTLYR